MGRLDFESSYKILKPLWKKKKKKEDLRESQTLVAEESLSLVKSLLQLSLLKQMWKETWQTFALFKFLRHLLPFLCENYKDQCVVAMLLSGYPSICVQMFLFYLFLDLLFGRLQLYQMKPNSWLDQCYRFCFSMFCMYSLYL